uniref:Membrane protein BRI3 n=1 Tax=Culicoides sonorensis TaxID=179676 RepID=A0A336KXL0_CULSO
MMQQTITTQVLPSAPPTYEEAMGGGSTTIQIHPSAPTQPYPHPIPTYGTMIQSNITTQPTSEPDRIIVREIIAVNACPVCRIGMLHEEFTCCGVCCGIFFFPIGLLCCLTMKDKVCSNCNAKF